MCQRNDGTNQAYRVRLSSQPPYPSREYLDEMPFISRVLERAAGLRGKRNEACMMGWENEKASKEKKEHTIDGWERKVLERRGNISDHD